jgi:hypothetical protein
LRKFRLAPPLLLFLKIQSEGGVAEKQINQKNRGL